MPITELKFKFSENKKILFIMTLLSIIVIYFIGLVYSSYIMVEEFVVQEQPYHFMSVSKLEDNKIIEDSFIQSINNEGLEIIESKSFNFILGQISKVSKNEQAWFGSVEIIPDREFNKLSNFDLKVEPGEAVTLLKLAEGEQNQWFTEDNLKIKLGDREYNFTFKKEIYHQLVNSSSRTSRFAVVLNELDYQMIEEEVQPQYKGIYNLYNFENWRQAKIISERLESFIAENIIETPNNSEVVRADSSSRIQLFEMLKQQYSVYLFLMSFIGLLFFVSSGSVLYLKLFTDFDRVKDRYKKLFRIGLVKKEMKKVISRELAVLFFLPVILGSVVAYVFIFITTTNFPMQKEILGNSFIIIFIYLAFQIVFYSIARKKYFLQVIEEV